MDYRRIAVMGAGHDKAVLAAIEALSQHDLKAYATNEKVFKTDGLSQLILVDNPDRYINYINRGHKRRNSGTNFTPKKKKRKR